jgi:hypothetical protein
MSNKFKFIQNLLENEKFDLNQKERFFKLVSRELEKSSKWDEEVLKDIRSIKKKIGLVHDGVAFNHVEEETDIVDQVVVEKIDFANKYDWVPSYINSSDIYKYLFDYNNNLILKSTCHKIDSNELKLINEQCGTNTYDFNKHLSKIIEAFEAHDKKRGPAFIKSFIRLYITGKDFYGNQIGSYVKDKKLGWTEDVIVFSWSDEKLKNWSEKNLGIPPCPSDGLARNKQNLGFEFETPIKNSFERNIATFSSLILHFKKMFHIKSDNSLRSIILQQNRIKKWNERINFTINEHEFPINIELFTYVERVLVAYNKIMELILEKADEKPEVKLIFREEGDFIFFKIHHLNNVYGKTKTGISDRMHGQVYKNMIRNQINGLCDLFVETQLESNEYLCFNIWDENYRSKKVNGKNILIDKVPIKISDPERKMNGVSHILRFKKK